MSRLRIAKRSPISQSKRSSAKQNAIPCKDILVGFNQSRKALNQKGEPNESSGERNTAYLTSSYDLIEEVQVAPRNDWPRVYRHCALAASP